MSMKRKRYTELHHATGDEDFLCAALTTMAPIIPTISLRTTSPQKRL